MAPYGIVIVDGKEKRELDVLESEKERLRAETWEYILIDILKTSTEKIIECFDFSYSFHRKAENAEGTNELKYHLNAWKFSFDQLEQSLSNSLRMAFLFTLISFCYGDSKSQYSSFENYFDEEFFKRVSLIYDIWTNRGSRKEISYIPLYESFHNLNGIQKNELIDILRAVFDDPNITIGEKQTLKNRLIDGAIDVHNTPSIENIALERQIVKPAVNFILLREKAKETLSSAKILYSQNKYLDCANRCYYSMLFALKSFLEYKGLLADWKQNELKESETHKLLDIKLDSLVASGVLSAKEKSDFEYVKDQRWKSDYSIYKFGKADAENCLEKVETFYLLIESLTT